MSVRNSGHLIFSNYLKNKYFFFFLLEDIFLSPSLALIRIILGAGEGI